MDAEQVADLINAWKDAVQAADLADRLAAEATAAGARAQARADVAAAVASMAAMQAARRRDAGSIGPSGPR